MEEATHLLTTTNDRSALPDLRAVAQPKLLQIHPQRTRVQHLPIPLLVEHRPEKDVVPNGVVQEPRGLGAIGRRVREDVGVVGEGRGAGVGRKECGSGEGCRLGQER